MKSNAGISDAMSVALDRARGLASGGRMVGYGVAEVIGEDGTVKQTIPFANLITTAGDEYYIKKAAAGISPASLAAPTAASGMKLGSGSTAAAKSSTGAALVTYITASNKAFDSSYPAVAAVGGDAGWSVTYKTTWAAGEATNSNIQEVVIANDAGTNATSSAANTYARAVLTAVNKGASDTLAITWTHTFLGA